MLLHQPTLNSMPAKKFTPLGYMAVTFRLATEAPGNGNEIAAQSVNETTTLTKRHIHSKIEKLGVHHTNLTNKK